MVIIRHAVIIVKDISSSAPLFRVPLHLKIGEYYSTYAALVNQCTAREFIQNFVSRIQHRALSSISFCVLYQRN